MTISLTKKEQKLGWVFLAAQLLLLPMVLQSTNDFFRLELSAAELNFTMFCINFVLTVFIFRRFLWESAKLSLGSVWRTLRWAGIGFAIYYAAMTLLSFAFSRIAPDFINANDQSIQAMTNDRYVLMAIGTILLVPITEETLYRALIFGTLRRTNRILAYAVSTVAFSALHIVSYIGSQSPLMLLLSFVQYLPAGIALALAYDKADSIWASILIHMTVNQIGILSVR